MVLEWIKKESDVKRTQICEIMGLFGILIQKEHDEKKKTFAKNEPDAWYFVIPGTYPSKRKMSTILPSLKADDETTLLIIGQFHYCQTSI